MARFHAVDGQILSLEYAGKTWSFRGWQYLAPDGIRDYLPLGVEGKRVLDVGASIGEGKTPIEFALVRLGVGGSSRRRS